MLKYGIHKPRFYGKVLKLRFGPLFFHCLITFDLLHPEVENAVFSEYNGFVSCPIFSSSSSESDDDSSRLFAVTSSSEESSVGASLLSDGRLSNNSKAS
ncbi:hypothetical protein TNCV_3246081 [Trichonephila clavipes]|nr:hypothetical protein TNCV_3246081 [Trichonephila clavipes]